MIRNSAVLMFYFFRTKLLLGQQRKAIRTFSLLIFLIFFVSCSGIIDDVRRASISPDGSQIIFDYNGKLYLMTNNGKQVTPVRVAIEKNEEAWGAFFAPDGKKVVYIVYRLLSEGGEIYSAFLTKRSRIRLTNNRFHEDSPSFSPDGSKIVFWRCHTFRSYSLGGYVWDNCDIYIMNADGSGEKRLTWQNYHFSLLSPPYFSKNGKEILYSADGQIFKVGVENSQSLKALTQRVSYHDSDPYFSPDGKKIVFISDRVKRFHYELWLMDADGSHAIQVTSNQPIERPYNRAPFFSSDGQKIFFLSDLRRDGKYSLWVVDVNDKKPHLITMFRKQMLTSKE